MNIKFAEEKDLLEVANLYRTEYSEKPYNEKWDEETTTEIVKNYFKKSKILVAEDNQRVIGFIIFGTFQWSDGQRGHIKEIVITKEFQGQGIGTKLMKKAEEDLSKSNIKIIRLSAHIESRAINLYHKLGFKENGLVQMEKEL
jgi:ribosomal protein S18 acetylase RimI-like enzyme